MFNKWSTRTHLREATGLRINYIFSSVAAASTASKMDQAMKAHILP